MIDLIPNMYNPADEDTHYEKMIMKLRYKRILFLFADNRKAHGSDTIGANSAKIRPYNRYSNQKIPNAAGISTGSTASTGGYAQITDKVHTYQSGEKTLCRFIYFWNLVSKYKQIKKRFMCKLSENEYKSKLTKLLG